MLLSESRTMKNCFALSSEGLLRQRSLGESGTQSRVSGHLGDIEQRCKMILTTPGTDLILRLLVHVLMLMYSSAELSGIHTCGKFPLQISDCWTSHGCIMFMNEKWRGSNLSNSIIVVYVLRVYLTPHRFVWPITMHSLPMEFSLMGQHFHWIQGIQRIWEITEAWIGFSIRICSVACGPVAEW